MAAGEGFQRGEALGKFSRIEPAVAVKCAEEIGRRAGALLRVAVGTAGDQVAVGIRVSPGELTSVNLCTRKDVVQHPRARVHPAAAIEAAASFAAVDGFAVACLL